MRYEHTVLVVNAHIIYIIFIDTYIVCVHVLRSIENSQRALCLIIYYVKYYYDDNNNIMM